MDSPKHIGIERIAAWAFVGSLTVAVLIYFSTFLQPVMLAVMVWYFIFVFREFVGRIEIKGRRLPKWANTILAFVVITLLTFGIVEIVNHNLEKIIERFPVYAASYRSMVENVQTIQGFDVFYERVLLRFEDFDFRPLLNDLLNGLSSIAGNILLIIIYVGFLLVEEKFFARKLDLTFAEGGKSHEVRDIVVQVNEAVRVYVFVKTQMSVLTGFLSYLVLLAFGVDFPILWAFLIFLFNYIPYIGSLIATLLPAAFAVFQFQSLGMFLWLFLAIQVVQFGVGNVLEPKVMGKTLNLSPLGVLLALTFWGVIWGILGMILSVPITSIMVIVASHVPTLRPIAIWLSESGDVGTTQGLPPPQS